MGVGISKQIGWSQESNLLYEILRELDYLNLVTASATENCICPTTTSTTTLTSRKTFLNLADPFFRGGYQTDYISWWSGNTVANVTATNPEIEITGLAAGTFTYPRAWNISRIVAPSTGGPFVTITPDYTTVDFRDVPIAKDLESLYKFTKKIATDSFMASRNPVVKIYRASNYTAGSLLDGWFITCIEFDSTGEERDGYDFTIFQYDIIPLPTVIPFPFTYGPTLTDTIGPITDLDIPMGLYPPTTEWIMGVTTVSAWTIEEEFPIPPAWG